MGEARSEPPLTVLLAGFVIDFHHRNACSHCRPDGICPRLTRAGEILRAWRGRTDESR